MIPATLQDLAVPLDTLRPYARNPRRGDVATIVESLRANGQYRPIVVRSSTREVLAGNHTLAAAREVHADFLGDLTRLLARIQGAAQEPDQQAERTLTLDPAGGTA